MWQRGIEGELLDLERQYWQALKDRDVDTVMRLTDDPCLLTGAQGVSAIGPGELGSMMRAATYTLESFELSDNARVRLLGQDVAVVAYEVTENLTVDGRPVTLQAADASTWVRRDGNWRCALHTESIAGDPFGRDRSQ
jgi:uncharacterized protein (TIGR02246 family)